MTLDHRNGTLESLLEPLLDPLFYTALDMTGNAADAEDVTQDAFMKAMRGFGTYDPSGSFKGWMFRILTNTVIDFFRKRKRAFPLLDGDEAEASRPGSAGVDLEQALRNLDPEQRLAVILVDLHDFSMNEASEMMGCPVGTVGSRLSRARAEIRRTLKT